MAINRVGNLTAAQVDQIKKNVKTGVEEAESAVKQKNDKKKLALTLGALGVAGAAAVGIAMSVRKGKTSDAAEVVKDGAKKLSDLKFEKGIAKQGDDLFTGVIEDTLKSGKKVVLEYQDGKIQKSTVNDISKHYGYGENFKKVNGKYLFYDENGKIEAIALRTVGGSKTTEFKNGKLIGEFYSGKFGLENGVIYDPNSKGKKVIKSFDQTKGITEHLSDGSTKTRVGNIANLNKAPLDELEVKNPREIVWEDKEGNLIKDLSITNDKGHIQFELQKDDDYIAIAQKRSPIDSKKMLTTFDSETHGCVIFEDDVINKTYNFEDSAAFKKSITELFDVLKAEKIEVSDKIKTLFEKI